MSKASEWRWKNFEAWEVQCRCGCGGTPKPHAMDNLQALRDKLGFQLIITSGMRCPYYNNEVSSTGLSGPHTTGTAFDIAVNREQAVKLLKLAMKGNWRGFGISQKGDARFIHLDMDRKDITIWSY